MKKYKTKFKALIIESLDFNMLRPVQSETNAWMD